MPTTLTAPPPIPVTTIDRVRPAGPSARRLPGTIAAVASMVTGAIHLGVAPAHLEAWPLEAWAFAAVALVQVGAGVRWLLRRDGASRGALVVTHLLAVVTWAVTRTAGWPVGPFAGDVEPVAAADAVAVAAALVALVGFRAARPGRLPRGRARAVLAGAVALVTVVAPAVAVVPGLAHDPADHAHGFALPADEGPDGLDPRRRTDSPLDGTAVPVGRAPVDVALGHGYLWVVNGRDATVTRLTSDGRRVDVLAEVGDGATSVVTGRTAMWVAAASGTITRLDPATGAVTGRAEVGGLAKGLAVGPDGAVFATTAADGRLHRIDPEDLAVTSASLQPGVLPAFDGSGPSAVAVDGDVAWVVLTLKRQVARYDARTLAPIGDPLPTGAGAADVLVDGDRVWVANTTDGTLSRYDRATGAPLGDPVVVDPRPEVGGGPAALTAAFGSLWVLNNDERTVTRVDPEAGTVLGAPLFLANHHAEVPRAVGIVGGPDAVWATDHDGDQVVRLTPAG